MICSNNRDGQITEFLFALDFIHILPSCRDASPGDCLAAAATFVLSGLEVGP